MCREELLTDVFVIVYGANSLFVFNKCWATRSILDETTILITHIRRHPMLVIRRLIKLLQIQLQRYANGLENFQKLAFSFWIVRLDTKNIQKGPVR